MTSYTKQWVVSWDEKAAIRNAKFYDGKFDGDTEIWKIIVSKPKHRSSSGWKAYVIKSSTVDITTCRDPHFDYLLDDPDNYRQVSIEELSE